MVSFLYTTHDMLYNETNKPQTMPQTMPHMLHKLYHNVTDYDGMCLWDLYYVTQPLLHPMMATHREWSHFCTQLMICYTTKPIYYKQCHTSCTSYTTMSQTMIEWVCGTCIMEHNHSYTQWWKLIENDFLFVDISWYAIQPMSHTSYTPNSANNKKVYQ